MPRRFERREVIICTYAARFGLDDLGGLAQVARTLDRIASSLSLKIRNIAAMLDEHVLQRDPTIRPLTGRAGGLPPRDTDWDVVVEPFTRLTRAEHLAVCRFYLQA